MTVLDLHVHTVRGSGDSSLTPEQLTEESLRIGLDGVCVTEHSGGWELDELSRTFAEPAITVIKGLEVQTDMGHVLVFGLSSHIDGTNNIRTLRQAVDKAGGVMISAHPFRYLFDGGQAHVNLLFDDHISHPKTAQEAAGHPLFDLVDAVEVANGSNSDRENLFALEVAQHLGMGGTGGSDAHSAHGLGRCVTIFEGDIRSEVDLIEALRARAFSPGQGLNVGQLRAFGPDAGN